jgi:hypothetical protein
MFGTSGAESSRRNSNDSVALVDVGQIINFNNFSLLIAEHNEVGDVLSISVAKISGVGHNQGIVVYGV